MAPEGQNDRPWALVYKGPQGENPELLPEHAVYEGVGVRDDAGAKTLVFTWQLTLDYSPVKYPVRMYVTLPDGGELLQWNLEADLPAGWLVTDVKFPRIVIDRPAAGKVITTEGWGVENRSTLPLSRLAIPRMLRLCSSCWCTTATEPFTTAQRTAGAAARPTRCSVRTKRSSSMMRFLLRPAGSKTERSACPGLRSWALPRRLGGRRRPVVSSFHLYDRVGQQTALCT